MVSQLHMLTIPGSILTTETSTGLVAQSCNPATGEQKHWDGVGNPCLYITCLSLKWLAAALVLIESHGTVTVTVTVTVTGTVTVTVTVQVTNNALQCKAPNAKATI